MDGIYDVRTGADGALSTSVCTAGLDLQVVVRGEDSGQLDFLFFDRSHNFLRIRGIHHSSFVRTLIHQQVHVVVRERGKNADPHLLQSLDGLAGVCKSVQNLGSVASGTDKETTRSSKEL